jgi:hypothetical protein
MRRLATLLPECGVDQIRLRRSLASGAHVKNGSGITSIISDTRERDLFLRKIFHIVNTPT